MAGAGDIGGDVVEYAVQVLARGTELLERRLLSELTGRHQDAHGDADLPAGAAVRSCRSNSTTGTTPNEEFVGRVSGDDAGRVTRAKPARRRCAGRRRPWSPMAGDWRDRTGSTFRKEAEATAPPPAVDGREDQVVNTAQDILTVNPDRSGKQPDYRLPSHSGWFRRCRYTGEVQWVPASAVSDRRPVHRRRGRIPDRPTSPACGRWSGRAGSQPERVQATVAR